MTILDDNVLIKVEYINKKDSKIILPESVKESDAVDKKFIVADFGSKVTDIQKGQKVWIDTFCPRFTLGPDSFLIKRESIYAVE